MALIYFEGWNHYTDVDEFFDESPWDRWETGDAGHTIETTNPRVTGNPYYFCSNVGGGNDHVRISLGADYGDGDTIVVGCAIYIRSVIDTQYELFAALNGVTRIFTLEVSPAGELELYNGNGVTLMCASATGLISNNTWYYVEWKYLLSATVGTAEIQLNGSSVASATGLNTLTSAHQFWSLDAEDAIDMQFDDFYVLDGTGAAPWNDFLGDVTVETLIPNADGTTNDFSRSSGANNFEMVDEALRAPDDDTTYIFDTAANSKELFAHTNLADNTVTIYGVNVQARLKQVDSGSGIITMRTKSTTDEQQSAQEALTMDTIYQWKEASFQTYDGTTQWTGSLIDGAEFGVELE